MRLFASTLTLTAALTAGVVVGCGRGISPPFHTPEPPAAQADATLFLVGDMGELAGTDPVLHDLHDGSAAVAGRTAVLFLGDNVYPNGVPAHGEVEKPKNKGRDLLTKQLDTLSAVPRYYVPGNHDWDRSGSLGWERILAQQSLIEKFGGALLPKNGCPGPASFKVANEIRVIALDSEWFIREPFDKRRTVKRKPAGVGTGCLYATASGTDREIPDLPTTVTSAHPSFEAVRSLIEGDRLSSLFVIAMHHPIVTHGPHGGFPLGENGAFRLAAPLLYFRPIVCPSATDLCHPRYIAFVDALKGSLRDLEDRRIVFASGHDHSLQLIQMPAARAGGAYQIVSGSAAKTTGVEPGNHDTLFRASRKGYVRLDLRHPATTGRISVTALARCLAEPETMRNCSRTLSLW